jgi:hypothetical protein
MADVPPENQIGGGEPPPPETAEEADANEQSQRENLESTAAANSQAASAGATVKEAAPTPAAIKAQNIALLTRITTAIQSLTGLDQVKQSGISEELDPNKPAGQKFFKAQRAFNESVINSTNSEQSQVVINTARATRDATLKEIVNGFTLTAEEKNSVGNAIRDTIEYSGIPGKDKAPDNLTMEEWGGKKDNETFTREVDGKVVIKGIWGGIGRIFLDSDLSGFLKTFSKEGFAELRGILERNPEPNAEAWEKISQLIQKETPDALDEKLLQAASEATSGGTPEAAARKMMGMRDIYECIKALLYLGGIGWAIFAMISFIKSNTGCMMIELDNSKSTSDTSSPTNFVKLHCPKEDGKGNFWADDGVCANISGNIPTNQIMTTITQEGKKNYCSDNDDKRPECYPTGGASCPGGLLWHGSTDTKSVNYEIINVGDMISNWTNAALKDAQQLAKGGTDFLSQLLKWLPVIIPILIVIVVFGLMKNLFHTVSYAGSSHHFNFNGKNKRRMKFR